MKLPALIISTLWLLLTFTDAGAKAGLALSSELHEHWQVGSGRLTWLGMTVYQATLFAPQGEYRDDAVHAIRIDYRFSFDRRQLALRSLQEMERIFGQRNDREQVVKQLESVFCDVTKGDRILGIHRPGHGAEFLCNGELQGRITDPDLARELFALWLDPRTSEPALRNRLLGQEA